MIRSGHEFFALEDSMDVTFPQSAFRRFPSASSAWALDI